MAAGVKPPIWFWIVALLLVLWEGYGCYQCYLQFQLGAEAMGKASVYDRTLYASLPSWYNYAFLIATFGGLLGAVALLLRERRARLLFIVSFVAALVQFGYLFARTNIIEKKGAAVVLPVPISILIVCVVAIWFAGFATKKGWLGR